MQTSMQRTRHEFLGQAELVPSVRGERPLDHPVLRCRASEFPLQASPHVDAREFVLLCLRLRRKLVPLPPQVRLLSVRLRADRRRQAQ